jgi:spore germination cell wall hydrolase CwlJ-like protein
MSRRSSRRMWHAIAAFVPLPLIGVGCFVAFQGEPLVTEVEFSIPDPNLVTTAVRTADASASPLYISREAEKLFTTGSAKGPRADVYVAGDDVTDAGKQLITASLVGGPNLAKSVSAVRAAKGDRLKPTSTEMALNVPETRGPNNSLFMNASYSSPFSADFQVQAFRPDPNDLAYRPTEEALNFRYQGETQAEFEDRERRCLATAIYFEARGEPERGQIAVAQVILNRVRSPIFPQTICGVVYQGQMRKGCQFSFACDGHTDTPRDNDQWALAQDLSKRVMSGEEWLPEVGYSTFYHANYVSPRWARRMNKVDRIGAHIFYKKRNEEPYVVEALDTPKEEDTDEDDGYLLPTLSLASAVSSVSSSVNTVSESVTSSVSVVAGASPTAAPTQAMSLGYAASE